MTTSEGDKGMKMAGAMAVVAGRAVRPCDGCGCNKARWYCAADDAFLCEVCDESVHAANALAFRHERVRLTSSGLPVKMIGRRSINHGPGGGGGGGGGRAARHGGKKKPKVRPGGNPVPGSDDMPRVKVELGGGGGDATAPIDDHFTAEELTGNAHLLDEGEDFPNASLSCPSNEWSTAPEVPGDCFLPEDTHNGGGSLKSGGKRKMPGEEAKGEDCDGGGGDGNRWLQLDFDDQDSSGDEYSLELAALRDSVAGDQSLPVYNGTLQRREEGDSKPAMLLQQQQQQQQQLGGRRTSEKPFKNGIGQSEWIKAEAGASEFPGDYAAALQQNFACKVEGLADCDLRQVPSLRLDYADVMSSWSDRGMLWTSDGSQLGGAEDSTGGCGDMGLVPEMGGVAYGAAGADDGEVSAGEARRARVSRYKEKRRTRLFSKKIRYEVRKLNAERRPRMKGRFVKRAAGGREN